MKKKTIIVIILLLVIGSGIFAGGMMMKKAPKKDETQAQVMTAEELIEYFGLTEEEISNVDIAQFLFEQKCTEAGLQRQEMEKEDILELMKFYPKKENMEGRDFSYLMSGEALNGKRPDYQEIKYIAFRESDMTGFSVFIDMKAEKVYIKTQSDEYVHQDIQKAEVVLEEVDLSELIACLESIGIENWKGRYESDVVHGIGWKLGIEFEDGTVASYYGYNAGPEQYGELRELMFSFYYP